MTGRVDLSQVESPITGRLAPGEVEMLAITALLRLHAIAIASGLGTNHLHVLELAADIRGHFGELEDRRYDRNWGPRPA